MSNTQKLLKNVHEVFLNLKNMPKWCASTPTLDAKQYTPSVLFGGGRWRRKRRKKIGAFSFNFVVKFPLHPIPLLPGVGKKFYVSDFRLLTFLVLFISQHQQDKIEGEGKNRIEWPENTPQPALPWGEERWEHLCLLGLNFVDLKNNWCSTSSRSSSTSFNFACLLLSAILKRMMTFCSLTFLPSNDSKGRNNKSATWRKTRDHCADEKRCEPESLAGCKPIV